MSGLTHSDSYWLALRAKNSASKKASESLLEELGAKLGEIGGTLCKVNAVSDIRNNKW